MAYYSLARKYRPATFAELVGQESVAVTLANAITLKREPHVVIFSGVRGIGKTTTARLYAKALNCDHGPTATPCDRCESCQTVTLGTHPDVIEIDGASNTSVDDVRALRETIGYVPQRSPFKIYIIDEVHMLSQSAFNALLKTLEEPPPHVVFMMATTELNKVPETIISRAQTYYLQKLSAEVINERLRVILAKEEITYDELALKLISREGHGSMRDALTLLDQAVALGNGRISVDELSLILSNLSSSPYLDILAAMVAREPKIALQAVASLDQSGVDFSEAVEAVAKMARHAFIIRDLGAAALEIGFLELDDQEVARLQKIAKQADAFDLNRIFRSLYQCRLELDGSGLDRYVVENYIFEWCLNFGAPALATNESPAKAQSAPVAISPEAPKKVVPSAVEERAGASVKEAVPHSDEPADILPAAVIEEAQTTGFPADWRNLVERWKRLKPLQGRTLEEVYVQEYSPSKIVLLVKPNSMASRILLPKEGQQKLAAQFSELFSFGGQLSIQLTHEENPSTAAIVTPAAPESASKPNAQAATNESLLDIKRRETALRREQIIEEAKSAAPTQAVLSLFGGTIKDIKLRDE